MFLNELQIDEVWSNGCIAKKVAKVKFFFFCGLEITKSLEEMFNSFETMKTAVWKVYFLQKTKPLQFLSNPWDAQFQLAHIFDWLKKRVSHDHSIHILTFIWSFKTWFGVGTEYLQAKTENADLTS